MDLSNLILDWYNGFQASTVVQTSVLTIVGAGIMGAVGFFLVKVPKSIWSFIKRETTTTLAFNSQSSGWSDYNQQQYIGFILWLSKTRWFDLLSRELTIDSMDSYGSDGFDSHSGLGPGIGKHLFRFKGRFYIASITEKESQGTTISKFNLSITTFGRSHKPIRTLLENFEIKNKNKESLFIFNNGKEGWERNILLQPRSIETVIVEPGIIENILEKIEIFIKDKQWYYDNGINYKIAILLYGVPGTGKTSLMRALACHLKRNIYNYEPSAGDADLGNLLPRAKGGIVTIEDIDGYGIANKSGSEEEKKEKGEITAMLSEASLSSLINAIDGISGLDDIILFISTNSPEKLDQRLLRDGRIDYRIEIPVMSNKTISRYALHAYGDNIDVTLIKGDKIPGASVQTAYILNRYDYRGFVNYINNWKPEKLEKVM